MMKKYRVNEVAKDLNVENKDVIEALKPFSDEPKKYMTALTEEDLDVVFDTFTKENSVESFDAYFAEREDAQPTSSSKEAPESKENTTAKVQEKAVVEKEKTAVKPAVKESKSNAANKKNKQNLLHKNRKKQCKIKRTLLQTQLLQLQTQYKNLREEL